MCSPQRSMNHGPTTEDPGTLKRSMIRSLRNDVSSQHAQTDDLFDFRSFQ
jgi:hypothetical protein